MSLLIKALDKAEKAQLDQQKLEQAQQDVQQVRRRSAGNIANDQPEGLDPIALSLADEEAEKSESASSFVSTQYSGEHSSERANNMFAAKVEPRSEMKPIVWIVLFGVLSFLTIVGYFYYQLNVVNAPTAPMATPSLLAKNNSPAEPTPQNQLVQAPTQPVEPPMPTASLDDLANEGLPKSVEPQVEQPSTVARASERLTTGISQNKPNRVVMNAETPIIELKRSSSAIVVPTIASPSASIQVSKTQSAPAISPVLTNAYNAYLAGNNQEAQSLYKRVLQRDIRNVDALLGMGAIAEREGRVNDALGWYQKVLEVEPKNTTALSAYAANVAQDDQASAAKFRKILQENPSDANAHASLGAYYAGQSQWSEAQQSYFEAYRLHATAENAFNLAVSLDQMGKPALALPYYQQALAVVNASNSATIDISALQARIASIQSQQ